MTEPIRCAASNKPHIARIFDAMERECNPSKPFRFAALPDIEQARWTRFYTLALDDRCHAISRLENEAWHDGNQVVVKMDSVRREFDR